MAGFNVVRFGLDDFADNGTLFNCDDYQAFLKPSGRMSIYGPNKNRLRQRACLYWHHTAQFPPHLLSLVPPELVCQVAELGPWVGPALLTSVLNEALRVRADDPQPDSQGTP